MNKTKLKKDIEKYLFKNLKSKNKRYIILKKNTNLFEQGIDSIDFFSLMFDLEAFFNIKINTKIYSKLNSINKIEKVVFNLIKKNKIKIKI